MARVDLRAGRFTPSRGLCGERVSHIEGYLSQKSGEWDWRVDALATRISYLDARVKDLESRLASYESGMSDEADAANVTAPIAEGGDAE
jgi:hypothetical protein